jgi:hypothetical protein
VPCVHSATHTPSGMRGAAEAIVSECQQRATSTGNWRARTLAPVRSAAAGGESSTERCQGDERGTHRLRTPARASPAALSPCRTAWRPSRTTPCVGQAELRRRHRAAPTTTRPPDAKYIHARCTVAAECRLVAWSATAQIAFAAHTATSGATLSLSSTALAVHGERALTTAKPPRREAPPRARTASAPRSPPPLSFGAPNPSSFQDAQGG